MTQYTIDIGAVPDDGQGDPLRTAFSYTNQNFDQVFAAGPVLSNVAIANNTIRTTNSNGNLVLSPNGIGKIQVTNAVIPSWDNVYDLGSPTLRFNTIYVGTGGLNIPSISVTGNITANYFIGNGSLLTGIAADTSTKLGNGTSQIAASVANGNITVSIAGVANTVVFTDQGISTDTLTTVGNIIGGSLISGASLSVSDATVYGNIATIALTATGNVSGNYFLGNGALLTGIITTVSNITSGNSNVAISAPDANVTISVDGTDNVVVFANTGAYITGIVSATGNITAPNFIGNVVGNISGNLTVPGSNTQVLFNDAGLADATSGFTFDKSSNLVTVGGNVSAVGFTGNGGGLANVMADRGSDPNNWNTLIQMGVYAVNRTSWAGTIGTPLDSQVYVGVLEVMNSGNTAIEQNFYPGTTSASDVKVQWSRAQWASVWTSWTLMTNAGQIITGGDF